MILCAFGGYLIVFVSLKHLQNWHLWYISALYVARKPSFGEAKVCLTICYVFVFCDNMTLKCTHIYQFCKGFSLPEKVRLV